MKAVLKLLALPTIFILPWLFMKLWDRETLILARLDEQPELLVLALLPGTLLFIVWMVKQLRK